VPQQLKTTQVKKANMEDLRQQIFDVVFTQNNFVEAKKASSALVRKEMFNNLQVTVLVPATRKRARRNSLILNNVTFNQIFQPPPPPPPQQQPQQQGNQQANQ
jgi:hypothetical protein